MKNKNILYKAAVVALALASFISSQTHHSRSLTDTTDHETVSLSVKCDTAMTLAKEDTRIASRFAELFLGKKKAGVSEEQILLYPCGDAFGIKIFGAGVKVVRVIDEESPLREDDKIIAIDDQSISTLDEVRSALSACRGENIKLQVIREEKRLNLYTTPKKVADEYHLGVILTDGAAGIGTITYIDPKDGSYGGLGHGICDADSGELLSMSGGNAVSVILGGAIKGEHGKPGELRGVLTENSIGNVTQNTALGAFGVLSGEAFNQKCVGEPMVVGKRDTVKEGAATIISTVKNGKKAEYSIQIHDIDKNSTSNKSFRITVTDPTLIALTGGIVRGMSGSPIIQDGKLVGAVTHVLVANPTEGYGIFIENMLNASQMTRNELPAA